MLLVTPPVLYLKLFLKKFSICQPHENTGITRLTVLFLDLEKKIKRVTRKNLKMFAPESINTPTKF